MLLFSKTLTSTISQVKHEQYATVLLMQQVNLKLSNRLAVPSLSKCQKATRLIMMVVSFAPKKDKALPERKSPTSPLALN